MAGLLLSWKFPARFRVSVRPGAERAELIGSTGDPNIIIELLYGANYAELQAGEVVEVVQLAPATAGRAAARCFLGVARWQDDFDTGIATARMFDATTFAIAAWFKYGTIMHGTLLLDSAARSPAGAGWLGWLQTALISAFKWYATRDWFPLTSKPLKRLTVR
jgi:adenylate cyclase